MVSDCLSAVINYLTEADTTGENSPDIATLSATNLVPGNNVIAVEIHEESTGSSDVSLDFEFVLHWTDPAARLQTTDTLAPNATWTTVAGATSPVTISPANTPVFYRLVR